MEETIEHKFLNSFGERNGVKLGNMIVELVDLVYNGDIDALIQRYDDMLNTQRLHASHDIFRQDKDVAEQIRDYEITNRVAFVPVYN